MLPGELARYLFTNPLEQHFAAEQVRAHFKEILHSDNSELFRRVLRELKHTQLEVALYGNADAPLEPFNPPFFSTDQQTADDFQQLTDIYHYFSNDKIRAKALADFGMFLKLCKVYAIFIEEPDRDISLSLQAFKLVLIFGGGKLEQSSARIDKFLLDNQPEGIRFHDVLNREIPINVHFANKKLSIDIPLWRRLILENGFVALDIFGAATMINEALGHNPNNFQKASNTFKSLEYTRSSQNPALAHEAKKLHIRESYFNQALDIDRHRKESDKLPGNIDITENDVNSKYHLIKMPINDPKIYFLGKYLENCLMVGANGARCIEDMQTLETCGAYVMLYSDTGGPLYLPDGSIDYSKYTIVGGAFAGLTITGNLLLDCWDNRNPSQDDEIAYKLITRFGEMVIEDPHYPEIVQVVIGTGAFRLSPKQFSEDLFYREFMVEGFDYGDAQVQKVVARNEIKANKIYDKLESFLENLLKDKLSSDKLDVIMSLILQEDLCTSFYYLREMNKLFTNPATRQLLINHFDDYSDYYADNLIEVEDLHFYWSNVFFFAHYNLLTDNLLHAISLLQSTQSKDFYKALLDMHWPQDLRIGEYRVALGIAFKKISEDRKSIGLETVLELISKHLISPGKLRFLLDSDVPLKGLPKIFTVLKAYPEVYTLVMDFFDDKPWEFSSVCDLIKGMLSDKHAINTIPYLIDLVDKHQPDKAKTLSENIAVLYKNKVLMPETISLLKQTDPIPLEKWLPILKTAHSTLLEFNLVANFFENFKNKIDELALLPEIMNKLQSHNILSTAVMEALIKAPNRYLFECILLLADSPFVNANLVLKILRTQPDVASNLTILVKSHANNIKLSESVIKYIFSSPPAQQEKLCENYQRFSLKSPAEATQYLENVCASHQLVTSPFSFRRPETNNPPVTTNTSPGVKRNN